MFRMKIQQIIERLKGEFLFIRGNILVLIASWVLMSFSRPIPDTYYPLFVQELGGTPSIIGLIGFAQFIILALVQFPGGYLADKYGRRGLIVSMTFGAALANVFYAVAPSWHFILIGAVIFSLCLIYQPALLAIEADSLPPEKRGMGFSILRIVDAFSIASPLIAGFLYLNYGLIEGMRIAYWFVTIAFLSAAIIRIKLKETLKVDAKRIDLIDIVRNYPVFIRESIVVWRFIPRGMMYIFLIYAALSFFSQMCSPYYIVYASEELLIEKFQWSLFLTLQSAVIFGSTLPIGKLIDIFGRKKSLVILLLLSALGIPFFIYGDSYKLIIFFILSGVSSSISIAYQSLEADLVPREYRGRVIGFTRFFTYVLASIGQLLGGFLYEKVSPQLPFLLLLASTIASTILALLLIHEPGRREV
jgi:MFS family permease